MTKVYLGLIILTKAGDTDLVAWSTYWIWLLGYQMATWPMTSRDPERSRSWPQSA